MLNSFVRRIGKLFVIYSIIALAGALIFLAIALTFNATASAQQTTSTAFSNIKIKNFGQMDERFYRGAQPKESDYKDLAVLGITTVIDLQAEPKTYERQNVEALGMRYVHIPMIAKKYPKEDHITTFLKVIDDPATGKFFVHCAGGRHRTGVVGAVYRFRHYGWNFDQVYQEMKKYDFYTSWGHGDFKKYIEDYWQRLQNHTSGSQ